MAGQVVNVCVARAVLLGTAQQLCTVIPEKQRLSDWTIRKFLTNSMNVSWRKGKINFFHINQQTSKCTPIIFLAAARNTKG